MRKFQSRQQNAQVAGQDGGDRPIYIEDNRFRNAQDELNDAEYSPREGSPNRQHPDYKRCNLLN